MTLRPSFVSSAALLCGLCVLAGRVQADPVRAQWPQPAGAGTDVFITYSYSNLLDGSLMLLANDELRAATEEALGLWASYAPLHFVERVDSGPAPSDVSYAPGGHPQIRIGHHTMPELAHGYYPSDTDGLGGDVHFDTGLPWTLTDARWNFLEAVTHELGHALGLVHEDGRPAIMNSSYPLRRFERLGTAFLYPADVEALQSIYGAGKGSVQPLAPVPDAATALLVTTGLAVIARVRRRRGAAGPRA